MKNTLHLPLKKQWYEMIASSEIPNQQVCKVNANLFKK